MLLEPSPWKNIDDMKPLLKRQRYLLIVMVIGWIALFAIGSLKKYGNEETVTNNANYLLFACALLMYTFFDCLLMHIFLLYFKRVWEKTKVFDKDNKLKKILKVIIVAYNIVWIIILVCFKKILDKGRMEILFKYGMETVLSIGLALSVLPIVLLGINQVVEYLVCSFATYYPNAVGLHTYCNLLVLCSMFLFRLVQQGFLYYQLGSIKDLKVRIKLKKQICDKLDVIALIIIWLLNFLLKLGNYGTETVEAYLINGLFYSTALFTAWLSLVDKLNKT